MKEITSQVVMLGSHLRALIDETDNQSQDVELFTVIFKKLRKFVQCPEMMSHHLPLLSM